MVLGCERATWKRHAWMPQNKLKLLTVIKSVLYKYSMDHKKTTKKNFLPDLFPISSTSKVVCDEEKKIADLFGSFWLILPIIVECCSHPLWLLMAPGDSV